MKIVRFVRHHVSTAGPGYNAGELAGFPDHEADALVARKVAEVAPAEAPAEVRVPATLEELETEVLGEGYSKKAAKKIARERFDGEYGEEARYLDAGKAERANAEETETENESEGEDAAADGQASGKTEEDTTVE